VEFAFSGPLLDWLDICFGIFFTRIVITPLSEVGIVNRRKYIGSKNRSTIPLRRSGYYISNHRCRSIITQCGLPIPKQTGSRIIISAQIDSIIIINNPAEARK
jgi:hypothetical protein